MKINSRDLDLWAHVLGVSKDADAIAAIRKERIRVLRLAGSLTLTLQRYHAAGLDNGDAVMAELHKGASGALAASQAMERVQRAFERHERGAA